MTARILLLTALLVFALAPPQVAADERSAPAEMAERLQNAQLPWRDPLDLAVRLRGLSPATPLVASVTPPPLAAGFEQNFWILDQSSARLFQAPATLRLVTDHAYWFVQTGLEDRAPQPDLERSANDRIARLELVWHQFTREWMRASATFTACSTSTR